MEIIKTLAVPFAIIAMSALVYYWIMFFKFINTVGTTEIYACGDMSEDAHSAQEAHESSVRG